MPLGLKWVSCRQHIQGSCFCIHSASLCFLVGAFNPFTFKDFPGGSDGKVSVYNAGDLGSITGSGELWLRKDKGKTQKISRR